jgi:hypothetical protein
LVLAFIEPIIETTILQQIFRQWNFYKWTNNCVRRSWKYKELRCAEPMALKKERAFTQLVSRTVYAYLSAKASS